MSDDSPRRETFQLSIDRSIFGIQENRSEDEFSSPSWLDLEVDDVPVRVARGAARFRSLVGTHRALVTIEVGRTHSPPPSGFELIGRERYTTYSGQARLCNINAPYDSFQLARNSEYEFYAWRRGGDTAVARHDEMLGVVYPIEGLEEYLLHFVEK
ncbi:hypothetical protein [Streptomyces xanthophaeus]